MSNTKLISLAELAELVGGELRGDADILINNAWPIDYSATGKSAEGTITMLDKVEHLRNLEGTQASAVILPTDAPEMELSAIVVENPHEAFEKIVLQFRKPPERKGSGIHPTAVIDPTVKLGAEITIGPNVVIEANSILGDRIEIGPNCVIESNCEIGSDTWIGSRVTLYWGTLVGENCRLHSGTVLGADGFGYRQSEGRHELVPQLGTVELGDCVDVGANSTIDRGVYGPTAIGEGTKIDNGVQVGHNCLIGKHNLICAQVGIGGSTSTGDYVVMGGQAGVRDHIRIGDHAILAALSGTSNDVAEGETMLGVPATPQRTQKLQFAAVAKLPRMRKEFKQMKQQLEALLKAQEDSSTDDQAIDRAA